VKSINDKDEQPGLKMPGIFIFKTSLHRRKTAGYIGKQRRERRREILTMKKQPCKLYVDKGWRLEYVSRFDSIAAAKRYVKQMFVANCKYKIEIDDVIYVG